MNRRAIASMLLASGIAWGAAATAEVQPDAVNRIMDQGFNRSALPETASWLTDRIGGRMPIPTKPKATDPFEEEDPDEEE